MGSSHLLEAAADPILPSCPEDIIQQRSPDATVVGSLCPSSVPVPVPVCPSCPVALSCLSSSASLMSVSDLSFSNLCPNGIVQIRINREVSRWFPAPGHGAVTLHKGVG